MTKIATSAPGSRPAALSPLQQATANEQAGSTLALPGPARRLQNLSTHGRSSTSWLQALRGCFRTAR